MTSRQIRDAALKGQTCCGKVRSRLSGTGFVRCHIQAKVIRDVSPFCGHHDPAKKAAKDAAQKAAAAEREAKRQAYVNLKACERAKAALKRDDALAANNDRTAEAYLAADDELDRAVAAYREARGK